MAQINANLSEYEAEEKLSPLPPGWYEAEVSDSEIKQGKTSGNMYIQWEFQVIGKPNKVWMTTVLGNDIAMKILKTMATCLGHRNPNYIADTEELHGRRCQIRLVIKTDPNGDYDAKNEVKGFKPIEKKQAPAQPAVYQPIQQDFRPKPEDAAFNPPRVTPHAPATAAPPTTAPTATAPAHPPAETVKMPWDRN